MSYNLPGPLALFHSWYRHRFCLRDRLTQMAILQAGTVCDCSHAHLKSGLLDGVGFWPGHGDDVRCTDCGQVWVATADSDYYRLFGSDVYLHSDVR